MKIFSADHEFDYSWEEVSTANWRKYCPWNKETGHVVAVDTLSRTVEPSNGILRTERLITCKQNAPRWVSSFLGSSEFSYVYEVSYVTPPGAAAQSNGSQITSSPAATAKPAPVVDSRATEAAAPTTTQSQPKSGSSILKRAIWSKPPASQQTRSSATPPQETQKAPQPDISPEDPVITHIPAEPAIQDRPSEAAPPTTEPLHSTLPSPPAHPGPRSPSVTMVSTNLTFADLISCRETVTYTPAPSQPDIHSGRTRFEQNARITAFCGGWAKVKERIEGFTVERFGQNAERGRKGFEEVLETSRRVFAEERAKNGAAL